MALRKVLNKAENKLPAIAEGKKVPNQTVTVQSYLFNCLYF